MKSSQNVSICHFSGFGVRGGKKNQKKIILNFGIEKCVQHIYIYIREMPFEFPVGRAAMKMSRLYIYMVLWCFWSPFFNILFYLLFFRHKKVTKTYNIYVKLSFLHLSFLSARSHSAFYVSFFQLVVIFDFSICKFVTIINRLIINL